MKLSIILIIAAVFASSTHAKPGLIAPILLSSSQYHTQDQLGQYSYGYSNPQSAKAEVKTADGITQGSYSYVDAEGKLQSVHYTSDEINGFRVAATNLPVPLVPALSHVAVSLQHDPIEVTAAKSKLPQQHQQQQQHEEQLIHYQEHDRERDQESQQVAADEARAKDDKQVQQHPVAHQPILRTSLLTYSTPAFITHHLPTPGFAYSYGYGYPQYAYLNHIPTITTYSAATPYIATTTHFGHQPAGSLPAVPQETPEVAKARAEHIKAHEEAKARNL